MANLSAIKFVDVDNLEPEGIEAAVEAAIVALETSGFAVTGQQLQQVDSGETHKKTVVSLLGIKDSDLTAPGVVHESGTDRSSVLLNAKDPNVTRLYTLKIDNVNPGGSVEYTVAGFGINIQENTTAISPDIKAVWVGIEDNFRTTGGKNVGEFHFNCDWKSTRVRPLSFQHEWDETPANRKSKSEFEGSITVTEDVTGTPYVGMNSGSKRLWIYANNGAQISASTDVNTPVRGVEVTGSKTISATSGVPVPIEGLKIVDTFLAELSSYTVAELATLGASTPNQIAICENDIGGFPTLVISDGSNWRRSYDGATASDT